ncbi:MAG TPA: peptidyl-alpha-hydroxyglycine alpha-amidating lyase family protein [Xanthobacteraceae bacterium]|nr:peptidyl-alpha-hydroxyglycine alpha-amidating lyase family protein [Xanthobacteraceae bacterium]
MKKWLIGLLVLLSPPAFAQQAVPDIHFESVPDFLKLPPDLHLGEATGVAVNSHGHIFVFSRGNTSGPAYGASAAQLLEFAPDGQFIREIGHNLYAWAFGHAVRIDKDDNIWAVDKGSDMIVKFNPDGRVVMVFGRKQEASDEAAPHKRGGSPPVHEDGRFRQPTDVAWDPAGNIFIGDGYVNSRVGKADREGNWIRSWGERGNKPGEFNIPHSIAADAQGHVYVADRGNRRIQVFDGDGKFLRAMTIDAPVDPDARPAIGNRPDLSGYMANLTMTPGAPWTVCITPPPHQVLFTSDAFPGRIYKMSLDGKILGMFGKAGKQLKQFGWVHAIACPSEHEIYVAELLNWRVQKLLLQPEQRKASATGK